MELVGRKLIGQEAFFFFNRREIINCIWLPRGIMLERLKIQDQLWIMFGAWFLSRTMFVMEFVFRKVTLPIFIFRSISSSEDWNKKTVK